MEILHQDKMYGEGIATRGLLAVFSTLGSDHELVVKYRSELANLIN